MHSPKPIAVLKFVSLGQALIGFCSDPINLASKTFIMKPITSIYANRANNSSSLILHGRGALIKCLLVANWSRPKGLTFHR